MDNNKILVDADAMYALTDARDDNHDRAVKFYKQLAREKYSFLCTNTSYYEVLTILKMYAGKEAVEQFVKKSSRGLQLVFVDQQIHNLARNIFQKQTSKNVSFFDCLNMAAMNYFQIKFIFSFDQDYKKNGYARFGID